MTSLYTIICITVTNAITYICPKARIVKYPAKRIKVHNVRTLKLTTFFLCSSVEAGRSSSTTGNICLPLLASLFIENGFEKGFGSNLPCSFVRWLLFVLDGIHLQTLLVIRELFRYRFVFDYYLRPLM